MKHHCQFNSKRIHALLLKEACNWNFRAKFIADYNQLLIILLIVLRKRRIKAISYPFHVSLTKGCILSASVFTNQGIIWQT